MSLVKSPWNRLLSVSLHQIWDKPIGQTGNWGTNCLFPESSIHCLGSELTNWHKANERSVTVTGPPFPTCYWLLGAGARDPNALTSWLIIPDVHWFRPSLLNSLSPHANTLPVWVSRKVPSQPQWTDTMFKVFGTSTYVEEIYPKKIKIPTPTTQKLAHGKHMGLEQWFSQSGY